jgi:hypothetical protein
MAVNRNLGGFAASANISGFVANTKIAGLITNAQIDSVANTKLTGTITAPQIAPGVIPAGGFSNMQVFTSPGNFTTPPTTTKLKVTVVGGGGGGGAQGGVGCGTPDGSGGGGGGTAIRVTTVSANTPYPVTVGAGGSGGLGPQPVAPSGATSSFGSIASATGGGGGNWGGNNPGVGGAAGTGSIPGATTCGFAIPGKAGMPGFYFQSNSSGAGGGTFFSVGDATFGAGLAYGGGGRGGKYPGCGNPSAPNGFAGAAGVVIVEF